MIRFKSYRGGMLLPVLLGSAGLLAPTHALAADVSHSVSLLSDYRWRGVSLSDEEPSLQAEASVTTQNGVSVWGGLNSVSDDYGGAELELGASITRTAFTADWTVSAAQYVYPGEYDLDYVSLSAYGEKAIGKVTLQAGVEYSPAQSSIGRQDTYLWSGLSVAATETVSLNAHIGRDDGSLAPVDDAVDWAAGAEKTFGVFAVSVDYGEVESVSPAWVLGLHYRS